MKKTHILLIVVKKIIDIYIYSNLHIALGAMLSVFLGYATFKHIPDSDYPLLVFFGTIFIYSFNKLFEAKKVEEPMNIRRFEIFNRSNIPSFIYTILSGFGSLYFFIFLHPSLQSLLLIPALLLLLYTGLLFLSYSVQINFGFIKILLISIVWGFIIGIIPYLEAGGSIDRIGLLYFIEKLIFIFAITIPLVVRDLDINKVNDANATPLIFVSKWGHVLSYISMLVCIILIWLEFYLDTYDLKMAFYISIGYLISVACIVISQNRKQDYYYGLLYSTIIIVALFGIVSSGILTVLF